MYLSKCCFCVPLRTGLLMLAVFKILGFLSYTTFNIFFDDTNLSDMVSIINTIIMLLDVFFSSVLILGIYKSNASVVQVCYALSATILMLELVKCVVYITLETYILLSGSRQDVSRRLLTLNTYSLFYIALQSYIVILIRGHLFSMREHCISDPDTSAYRPRKPHIAY
ncbi:unnamed protein product [Leptidea sinapis]|uniref:Uncharacterized protein n=1 Tax=Leptidea sinapis TaxID=189913 RepID=A0A5E4QSB0_9NEOP|nr:unnamed protein product [Leptidea sinapis]